MNAARLLPAGRVIPVASSSRIPASEAGTSTWNVALQSRSVQESTTSNRVSRLRAAIRSRRPGGMRASNAATSHSQSSRSQPCRVPWQAR